MTIRCGNRVALLLAWLLLLAMALPFISYAPNRLLSGEGRWLWQVWPWLASGAVKPVIHTTFVAADAAKAHALMESSQHIGKIVLTW